MQNILVAVKGNVRFLYDEADVRKVCSIMRCGNFHEDCMALLKKGAMKCDLCHSMLKLFGKPCNERSLNRAT